MTVEINGVDYTTSVIAPSFKIEKNSNYQDDISMTIRTNDTIQAGMEIVVTDGSDIVFGGLLQLPKRSYESPTTLLQTIESSGYKQILARRTFEVDDTDANAGDTIQQLFDDFLKVGGTTTTEELTLGTIDTGAVIARKKGVFNGYKLFNSYAESSGYRWWIKSDKSFYFTDAPTYTAATKEITDSPGASDYFELLDYPSYDDNMSKFRTRQYVIGKAEDGSQIIGLAINATEEARLSALYGSGVYGGPVVYNNNLKTQTECDAAAQALLDANTEEPNYLTIKTRDFIDVNQTVDVTLSAYGLSADQFIVDKVTLKYDKTDQWLYYEAQLRNALDTAASQSSWTDDWNSAFNNLQQESSVVTDADVKWYIQDETPSEADDNDGFIDTNDYSIDDHQDFTGDGVVVASAGRYVNCSGTFTLTLYSLFTELAKGPNNDIAAMALWIMNTGSGTVTVEPNTDETINGGTSISLTAGQWAYLVGYGIDWKGKVW